MYLKIVKETSETRSSLDEYDINYFLDLFEGLSLKDYVESIYRVDSAMKSEEIARANKTKPPV